MRSIVITALIAVSSSSLSGQQPVLLRDVNPNPVGEGGSSDPGSFRTVGNDVYFAATELATGRELYRTTGVPGSTRLVADIRPGPGSSSPSSLLPLGPYVLFAADDGVRGSELWRTDGTRAGTTLVADLALGPTGSLPSLLTHFGNAVFFATATGEFWRTDGTASGTTRLFGGVEVVNVVVGATGLWLSVARQLPMAAELWYTDGTTVGTRVVASRPGEAPRRSIVVTSTDALFITDAGVYASDLATYGTQQLVATPDAHGLTQAAGRVFFAARAPSGSYELWSTDGTRVGTAMVPVPVTGLFPSLLLEHGGRLFFVANAGQPGLWATDGTAAGTTWISRSIGSGYVTPALAAEVRGISLGGHIVFESFLPSSPGTLVALWASDGTASGTVRLPGGNILSARFLADRDRFAPIGAGAAAVFASRSPVGVEPWRSDGTVNGSVMLDDIEPGFPTIGSYPTGFIELDGLTYFSASGPAASGNVNVELWRTDGTGAGTALVTDIEPGPVGSRPAEFARVGGHVYFAATTTASGRELWRSDGTASGTTLVKDIVPGNEDRDGPLGLCARNERSLVFAGHQSATGYELWISDGTATGTAMLLDIRPGARGSNPHSFQAAGRYVFFVADDGVHGQELWVTDGTAAGTHLVIDAVPGAGASLLRQFVLVGDRLLFHVLDYVTGANGGLWATDGTPSGTVHLVRRASPATAVLDGLAFFSADDPATGFEPWTTDGTVAGTRLLRDVVPGPTGSAPRWFVALDGEALFVTQGGQVWRTQGTSASTTLVHAAPGYEFQVAVALGSRQLAMASVDPPTQSVWVADGTTATRIADFGPLDWRLHAVRNRLLLAVDDPWHGTEPFVATFGASALPHGFACAAGLRTPRLRCSDPVLGTQMWLRGRDLGPATSMVAIIGAPTRTPLMLGGSDCALYVDPRGPWVAMPAAVNNGSVDVSIPVPTNASLAAAWLRAQAVVAPGGTALGFDLTNAVELLPGR